MSDDYEEKYTKPELRREIKDELMESDKGGRKGQWSARKAQLLVQEYEKRGGGYKGSKDEDAKSLEQWTEQQWQTADGSAYADDGDRMKRYLPKKAWDLLSDEEKQQAKKKKERGDADGKQFVENTIAAKAARAYVDHGDASELSEEQLLRLKTDELSQIARDIGLDGRSNMDKEELAASIRQHFENRLENKTRDELYEIAQERDIEGRSQMTKEELIKALAD